MDKNQFEEFKKTNHEEASYHFLDSLRGKLNEESYLEYLVSASVLALELKKSNEESLLEVVDKEIKDETIIRSLNIVWEKFSSEIKEYSNKYTSDDLLGVVLFAESQRYSDISVNQTPEGISKLAISLLDLTNKDRVLDLGSGVSSFLTQASLSVRNSQCFGVDINTTNVVISKLRQYVTGLPIEIFQGNILSKDYSYLKANKVFSNFPLGLRYNHLKEYIDNNNRLIDYFNHPSRVITGDWAFAMAANLNTVPSGRTVFLMSNSATLNSADRAFRRELIEKDLIEGVIQLPSNLLSSTAIPLTVVILSENNIDVNMVDASQLFTSGRRRNVLEEKNIQDILDAYGRNSKVSRTITKAEIQNNDYIINPTRYIGIQEVKNGIELGDIAIKIHRGSMIKSSELDELASDKETNNHYLMLQNIRDGKIDTTLPSLDHIDQKFEKYCVKDKNLIISKNAPFKIALANVVENEHILANGNLYFVDLDTHKINPTFALTYLLSEGGQAQLNQLSKGSVMRNISIQDLKKVQIPNLDREKQTNIAKKFDELTEHIDMLEKQIDLVKEKRLNLIEEEVLCL